MPKDRSINYVEFPARDLDAVETFYKAVFGWKFTPYGDSYRAFNDSHMDGGFYRSEESALYESGAPLVVFYAEDLEAAHKDVLANGGRISKDTFAFPGGRRFHFQDPHGNELAVWSEK